MKRQPEAELMDDLEQVNAYAQADFSIPHNDFINRLQLFINQPLFAGIALDLGCGPGDISRRFLRAFPKSSIHAVDGSKPMLDYGYAMLTAVELQQISFIHGRLPDIELPITDYDIIFSNSLLHHLPEPQILWQAIKQYAKSGAKIIVMDLLRPESPVSAELIVQTYAAAEPELLQRDFYHSLLAAFTLTEIQEQLKQAELAFNPEQISDRHIFITGVMP